MIRATRWAGGQLPDAESTFRLTVRWIEIHRFDADVVPYAADTLCHTVGRLRARFAGQEGRFQANPPLDALEALAWFVRDVVAPKLVGTAEEAEAAVRAAEEAGVRLAAVGSGPPAG